MYAIVNNGGKQYKVSEGDVITVDLMDAEPGQTINMSNILLISDDQDRVLVGTPNIADATVDATILAQTKGKKIYSYKFKRRQGYHRTVGHRSRLTQVKVDKINFNA